MRNTGMKNGVLSHHLSKLENDGAIQVHRSVGTTRFYPLHITVEESTTINALRRQTPRDIISALILHEDLEFSEIVKHVRKAESTISFYLAQLVNDKIVYVRFSEKKKKYHLKDRLVIDKLIEEYYPRLLEKSVDGYTDIINSL